MKTDQLDARGPNTPELQDEALGFNKIIDKFRNKARTDTVTELLNRRAFFEDLEMEIAKASRYGKPLSLLVIDVDSFKEINDRHGHHVGDLVLAAVADKLRLNTRVVDILGRLGGDEDLVALPETPVEVKDDKTAGAVVVANRLLEKTREPLKVEGKDIKLTLSIGIAEFEPGDDSLALYKKADAALYVSKRKGRNQLTVWRPGLALQQKAGK